MVGVTRGSNASFAVKAKVIVMIMGIVAAWAVSVILAGCAGPPTKFERTFFDVQTNRDEVVEWRDVTHSPTDPEDTHSTPDTPPSEGQWITNATESYTFTRKTDDH